MGMKGEREGEREGEIGRGQGGDDKGEQRGTEVLNDNGRWGRRQGIGGMNGGDRREIHYI